MNNVNACESELWDTTDSEDDTLDVSDDKFPMEGESEGLSDIDDVEVGQYLNNEKEMSYKKMIWEAMNQKYLQEQEAKRLATSAKVTNSKREVVRKRVTVLKKAQSTAKSACPTSPKKRPNARINYNALSNVLNEPLPSNDPKKRRSEPESNKIAGKSSARTQTNVDAGDATDEYEDENYSREDNRHYSHYSNQEEEYDYYDDDDEFF